LLCKFFLPPDRSNPKHPVREKSNHVHPDHGHDHGNKVANECIAIAQKKSRSETGHHAQACIRKERREEQRENRFILKPDHNPQHSRADQKPEQ
jgi:hypothetical protein